jgi:hypothetical protein
LPPFELAVTKLKQISGFWILDFGFWIEDWGSAEEIGKTICKAQATPTGKD